MVFGAIFFVYTMYTTLLWWANGRGGGYNVYKVCRIIFLVFSLFFIQKVVQVIISLKLNIRNLSSAIILKTHYFLQKRFSNNLQNVSKTSDLAAYGQLFIGSSGHLVIRSSSNLDILYNTLGM